MADEGNLKESMESYKPLKKYHFVQMEVIYHKPVEHTDVENTIGYILHNSFNKVGINILEILETASASCHRKI